MKPIIKDKPSFKIKASNVLEHISSEGTAKLDINHLLNSQPKLKKLINHKNIDEISIDVKIYNLENC